MNRVDRLMAIALHLQSRRVVRAEDLAAHFEISVRTVYRDITALSEAGIPVIAEAGVGYSLAKGYHLPPVMFTAEEASALFFGEKLVEQFTDASLRKQMESALLKIRSVLSRDRQDYLDRLERSTAVLTKPANRLPRLASETIVPIQRALAERRLLALDYLGGKRQEMTKRIVEPLGLVYYADNWHLIAFCRLRQGVRDFRTDRIQRLELKNETFPPRTDFSLKEYLEREMDRGDFEIARIRFTTQAMERVRREWSWGIIEEKAVSDGVEVTLLDCSFEYLTGWVMSFGANAEVLSPDIFRRRIAAEAERLLLQYGSLDYAPVLPSKAASTRRSIPKLETFSQVS
jgi:predicted DNA-binding transcriptional regulator YafY